MVAALMVSSLCNNSSVTKDDDEKDGEWKGIGDPTEVRIKF